MHRFVVPANLRFESQEGGSGRTRTDSGQSSELMQQSSGTLTPVMEVGRPLVKKGGRCRPVVDKKKFSNFDNKSRHSRRSRSSYKSLPTITEERNRSILQSRLKDSLLKKTLSDVSSNEDMQPKHE